jgi:hypothetical protein
MIVFWRLLLAHLLTDFTFQTDKIANWKRKSVFGILVHSSIFLILSLVLTRRYLGDTWWKFSGLVSLTLLFLIHFGEDYYRVWSIRKVNSTDNMLFFLWDQFIHIALIFLFSPRSGKLIGEKLVVLLILAIFVTHLTSILIYYLEQRLYGNEYSLSGLKNKYYLIAERFAMFLCLLMPGLWWISFIIVLLFCRFINRKLKLEFTKLNIIVGSVFVILSGILGRIILYN